MCEICDGDHDWGQDKERIGLDDGDECLWMPEDEPGTAPEDEEAGEVAEEEEAPFCMEPAGWRIMWRMPDAHYCDAHAKEQEEEGARVAASVDEAVRMGMGTPRVLVRITAEARCEEPGEGEDGTCGEKAAFVEITTFQGFSCEEHKEQW